MLLIDESAATNIRGNQQNWFKTSFPMSRPAGAQQGVTGNQKSRLFRAQINLPGNLVSPET
jgi:hypothetical protein